MVGIPALKTRVWQISKRAKTYKIKKVDRGENLLPKHCPNRKTSTSEIHVCRFGGGLKVASLES